MDVMKTQLRKQLRTKRNSLEKDIQFDKSYTIMETVVAHFEFLQSKQVLCYLSFQSEVDTKGIIEYAWLLNKSVFCPKIVENEIRFFKISNFDELELHPMGFYEPRVDETSIEWTQQQSTQYQATHQQATPYQAGEETIAIIPGLGFDLNGNRMGYGGGYYDQFLRKHPSVIRMGICYEEQILEELSVEEWDQPMQYIISDQQSLDF